LFRNHDSSSALIAGNRATERTFTIEDAELSRKLPETKGSPQLCIIPRSFDSNGVMLLDPRPNFACIH
jgi:hypothetical protein